MAITVSGTKTQPAVVMDRLHLDSFTINQERQPDSKKVIGMSAVLCGTDAGGTTVFDKETFGVSDTDIEATIVTAAVKSGRTVQEFMVSSIAARAAVNNQIVAGTLDDATLMAYFEAAIGRILELHGKITVAGIT